MDISQYPITLLSSERFVHVDPENITIYGRSEYSANLDLI
jgi:hypothetical protein